MRRLIEDYNMKVIGLVCRAGCGVDKERVLGLFNDGKEGNWDR